MVILHQEMLSDWTENNSMYHEGQSSNIVTNQFEVLNNVLVHMVRQGVPRGTDTSVVVRKTYFHTLLEMKFIHILSE